MNIIKKLLWSNERTEDNVEPKHFLWANRFSIVLQAALAFVIILVVEIMSRRSFGEAFGWAFGHPAVWAFNSLLVFVTLLFVYPFRHRIVMRIGISVGWLALGAVNGAILSQRVTPFCATDLGLIGDLLTMKSSKYFTTGQEVLIIIMLVVFIAVLVFLFLKGPRYKGPLSRIGALALAILAFCLTPVIMKAAIHAGIMAGYFGNLAQGYKEYGFAYSFACSVFDTGISEDSEYSRETIEGIQNNIDLPETSRDENDMPNIIMVQLETFVDPYFFNFLEYSEDPTPNYHRLMEEYGCGTYTVPVVGAGTVNTEFEALTGMGIQFFGIGEYPYKTILKRTTCESAATVLDDLGYTSHVVHNNTASFYGRHNVFANMGFDTFESKEVMDTTSYNEYESWLTDDILVPTVESVLDSTEGRDFVYTITVQSHGAYPTEQVIEDPAIQVTGGATEEENWQWQYYINELHEVDLVIGQLLDMLDQRNEDTVVMMYGDHLPTMNLTNEDMTTGDIFKTSYVTWNNFGLRMEDRDIASYETMPYLLDELDIHEGTMFRYQQYAMRNDLDPEAYRVAWRMLQYDMLYGDHWVYGGEERDFHKELQFGVEDVVVDHYEIDNATGQVFIYGTGFTPWSKVYLDGRKISTDYISGTCLRISTKKLYADCSLSVNQMCSSLVLRWSNSFTFEDPGNLEQLQANAERFAEMQQAAEEAAQAEAERIEALEQAAVQAEEQNAANGAGR